MGVCDTKTLDGLFADPPKIKLVERDGSVHALLEYAAHNALSDSPIHKRWGERYKQRKHDEQNTDTPRQLPDLRSWFGVDLGHRNAPQAVRTGGSPGRSALGMVFAVSETGAIRRPELGSRKSTNEGSCRMSRSGRLLDLDGDGSDEPIGKLNAQGGSAFG